MAGKAKEKPLDVYKAVTDAIDARLEEGTIPWRKPWTVDGLLATNLASKKPYRGINQILLGMSGYSSPYWVSFKQAKERGGKVRKGEKSTLVVFWKRLRFKVEEEDGTETTRAVPMLRYYRVFNAEQCDGLRLPEPEEAETRDHTPVQCAEALLEAYSAPRGPVVKWGGGRAFYQPTYDRVTIPDAERFHSCEEYYSTLFHELVHSTGHKDRLERKLSGDFGSDPYSREELVAELGASMLMGTIDMIPPELLDNSAAYIDGWRRALRSDPKLMVTAAARAQRAADYVQGIDWSGSEDA